MKVTIFGLKILKELSEKLPDESFWTADKRPEPKHMHLMSGKALNQLERN
jgi:hypothetical protein